MLIEDAGCSEEDSEQEKAQFLFNNRWSRNLQHICLTLPKLWFLYTFTDIATVLRNVRHKSRLTEAVCFAVLKKKICNNNKTPR